MRSTRSFVQSTLAAAMMVCAAGSSFATGAGDPVRDSIQASGSASLALATAVVAVPTLALYAGSTMMVVAVQAVGTGATLLLKGAAQGAEVSVTLGADVLQSLGLAVGQTVSVVAQGAGYLLVASGRAIAYVPGATEASLLHSSRSL